MPQRMWRFCNGLLLADFFHIETPRENGSTSRCGIAPLVLLPPCHASIKFTARCGAPSPPHTVLRASKSVPQPHCALARQLGRMLGVVQT